MDYVELRITASDPRALELLYADLEDLPVEAVQQDGDDLLAYIPSSLWAGQAEFPIAAAMATISWTERRIAHQNWNEVWESSFDALNIGSELIIYAPFHKGLRLEDYRYRIQMLPKMAFGTGHHPTTYLMLQRVLEADLRGLKVLDMGCGTAILAILALMHGAERALGIEIEPHAADNARELAELHELSDRLEVRTGDISALHSDEDFEVIYANIHRNVLLADMGRYASALKPRGQLHLSGFYRADLQAIEAAAREVGLITTGHHERESWQVLTVEKPVN